MSNSIWKLLWFEVSKILVAVLKIIYYVIYYNIRYTFVPCICILCFVFYALRSHVLHC